MTRLALRCILLPLPAGCTTQRPDFGRHVVLMHHFAIFITRAEQLADHMLFAVVLPRTLKIGLGSRGPTSTACAILGVLSITTSLSERTVAAANLVDASSDEGLVNALRLREVLPQDIVETESDRRQISSCLSFSGRRGSRLISTKRVSGQVGFREAAQKTNEPLADLLGHWSHRSSTHLTHLLPLLGI